MKNIQDKTISKMESLLVTASDKTRLKIMLALLDDSLCHCGCCEHEHNCSSCSTYDCMIEKCVNDIANGIGASQSLVSHQLKVLKAADLVGTRKEGTKVYYSLKDKQYKSANFIVTLPEQVVNNSASEVIVDDFTAVLEKSGDVHIMV